MPVSYVTACAEWLGVMSMYYFVLCLIFTAFYSTTYARFIAYDNSVCGVDLSLYPFIIAVEVCVKKVLSASSSDPALPFVSSTSTIVWS